MFNFNNTFTYGLRLLVHLSGNKDKPKQLKKIAQEENISLQYLRKVTTPLERAGIIKSLRGPGGGFMLNRSPNKIDLLVVNDAPNHSKVIDCVKGASGCRRFSNCMVKDLLEEVYNKIKLVFKNKTLAMIINPVRSIKLQRRKNKTSNGVKKSKK